MQARALRLADLLVEGMGEKRVGELDLALGCRPGQPRPDERAECRRNGAGVCLGHRHYQGRLEADPGHAGRLGDCEHRCR